MAMPNPTTTRPRLPSPNRRSFLHSPSPSQSPSRGSVRQFHRRDLDPLLRGLSPTKTLRAFSDDDYQDGSTPDELSNNDLLHRSVETASHAERALGVKAAQACADFRAWARELESWEWPGTFDIPEPARKKQRMSVMSLGSVVSRPSTAQVVSDESEEFWGSLAARVVRTYQERMDEINAELDDVDVEELKDFVLSAHSHAGYGDDDALSAVSADSYHKRLDDFTALVTATIFQALPYLSRITNLLHTWTVRLSILRSTPTYLHDLKHARADLDHGWAALAVSSHPLAAGVLRDAKATFSRETMEEMKVVIDEQVYSLGRRLDSFLNMLEGREECVPEQWIEDFEVLEEQYGEWVVQAERKVMEGEWRAARDADEQNTQKSDAVTGMDIASGFISVLDITSNAGAGAETLGGNMSRSVAGGPTIPALSINGSRSSTSLSKDGHTTMSEPLASSMTTGAPFNPNQRRRYIEGLDDLPDPSLNRPSFINNPTSVSSTDQPRSPHDPIVSDQYGGNAITDEPIFELSAIYSRDPLPSPQIPTPLSGNETDTSTNRKDKVQRRAAFLNNGHGETKPLNKSKPAPIVRPFEHASNAFTRLFKRDKPKDVVTAAAAAEESRTGSVGTTSVASSGSGEARDKRTRNRQVETKGLWTPFTGGDSKAPNLEYGDMVRLPRRTSEDAARINSAREGDARARKKERQRRMEYGDMISVPERSSSDRTTRGSKERPALRTLNSASSGRPRSTSERSKRSSKPSTSKQDVTALPRSSPEKPKGPETYQPTGLLSPSFQSPVMDDASGFEFFPPDNWPLSAEPSPALEVMDPIAAAPEDPTSESEEREPRDPMETDAFDRMFAEASPLTPTRPVVSFLDTLNARDAQIAEKTGSPTSPPSATSEGMFFWNEKPAPDRSLLRMGSSDNTRRIEWRDSTQPRPVSVVPEGEEEDEREDGTISSPESTPAEEYGGEDMEVGSAGGYFGSVTPRSQRWSRTSMSGVPTSNSTPVALQRSTSMPPVSPRMLKLKIPDSEGGAEASEYTLQQAQEARLDLLRRASTASIEMHPRSELRSIDIVRRSSVDGSFVSPPQSPAEAVSPASMTRDESNGEATSPISPVDDKDMMTFLSSPTASSAPASTPPGSPRLMAPEVSNLRSSTEQSGRDDVAESESDAYYSKQKYKDIPIAPRGRKIASPTPTKQLLNPGEDNFDRHVSEVLDRVRAPIRFRTRPGSVTPLGKNTAAKLPKANERPGKNLTLAPAESSPRKNTPAESGVKLYHLTQAGRTEPIKLYVRLVGEGERCMVRVGGGWADLADYLRQYAEHHGSRTFSDGGLTLQTAASTAPNGAGKRTFSGLVEPKALARRPMTPTTVAATPPTLERPSTKDSERSWLGRDQPRFTMGESEDEQSPIARAYGTQRSTPGSGRSASRPSTSQSATHPSNFLAASSLRQMDNSSESNSPLASLAGGKLKADLPEQKARWVEGMIERVNKSASAEKSREEKEKYFTEIGKAGATRRVVFRGNSAIGEKG